MSNNNYGPVWPMTVIAIGIGLFFHDPNSLLSQIGSPILWTLFIPFAIFVLLLYFVYGTFFVLPNFIESIQARLIIRKITGIWITRDEYEQLNEIKEDDDEMTLTIKVIEEEMKDAIIKRYSQEEYDYFVDIIAKLDTEELEERFRQMRKNRKDDRTDITDD